MKKLIVGTVLLLILPKLALAQKTSPSYLWQGYAFLGAGTGARDCGASCGTIWHGGAGLESFWYKGLGIGSEAGYAHWGPYDSNDAFVLSGNFSYHFRRRAARGQVDPFVVIGPTTYFPTSQGRAATVGDFGGGVNVWLAWRAALRLEIRDYVNPNASVNGWPGTHAVSFRVGITFR